MTYRDDTQRLIAEIDVSLGALAAAVDELAAHQARQLRRVRQIQRWTVIGLILDLALSGIGGLLYLQVHSNTSQIQTVNGRVSTQALCPLYDLFLRSYNPASPVAQQDPLEYNRDFTVIEQGARALGCAHVTRGR